MEGQPVAGPILNATPVPAEAPTVVEAPAFAAEDSAAAAAQSMGASRRHHGLGGDSAAITVPEDGEALVDDEKAPRKGRGQSRIVMIAMLLVAAMAVFVLGAMFLAPTRPMRKKPKKLAPAAVTRALRQPDLNEPALSDFVDVGGDSSISGNGGLRPTGGGSGGRVFDDIGGSHGVDGSGAGGANKFEDVLTTGFGAGGGGAAHAAGGGGQGGIGGGGGGDFLAPFARAPAAPPGGFGEGLANGGAVAAPSPSSSTLPSFEQLARWAGSDKSRTHAYHYLYDKYLGGRRMEEMKVLEIGFGCDQATVGASVTLWSRFLPQAELHFAESNQQCVDAVPWQRLSKRASVHTGDQANRADLRRWKREVGGKRPFDVIVDDGGRTNSVTWTTFHTLFHEALSDGGLYFIEDLYVGRSAKFTAQEPTFNIVFIEAVKEWIDQLTMTTTEDEARYKDSATKAYRFPLPLGLLSIECMSEMCVFAKCSSRPMGAVVAAVPLTVASDAEAEAAAVALGDASGEHPPEDEGSLLAGDAEGPGGAPVSAFGRFAAAVAHPVAKPAVSTAGGNHSQADEDAPADRLVLPSGRVPVRCPNLNAGKYSTKLENADLGASFLAPSASATRPPTPSVTRTPSSTHDESGMRHTLLVKSLGLGRAFGLGGSSGTGDGGFPGLGGRTASSSSGSATAEAAPPSGGGSGPRSGGDEESGTAAPLVDRAALGALLPSAARRAAPAAAPSAAPPVAAPPPPPPPAPAPAPVPPVAAPGPLPLPQQQQQQPALAAAPGPVLQQPLPQGAPAPPQQQPLAGAAALPPAAFQQPLTRPPASGPFPPAYPLPATGPPPPQPAVAAGGYGAAAPAAPLAGPPLPAPVFAGAPLAPAAAVPPQYRAVPPLAPVAPMAPGAPLRAR